jgi:hypothetical protein
MTLRLDPKKGDVTTAMRMWCYRLYHGARWWRTRDYAYTTYCDLYRTPHYEIVEKMRDLGLVTFVPSRETGIAWEGKLTELGKEIGRRPATADMKRREKK